MRSKLRTPKTELDYNPCSPVQDDFVRSVSYDEDGNELISFVKTDYPSIQASHGNITDWSLDSLVKAGVNPDFGIKTGFVTRFDGLAQLERGVQFGNSLADNIENVDSDKKSE